MSNMLSILKYIKPYTTYVIFNVFSNILSILFSLFSLTMVIPFLGILFGTQEKVYQAQELNFSLLSIKENFYFLLSSTIEDKGKVEALMLICLLVLIMFLLKNLFRYIALYFLSPIRNGIIYDMRMELQEKIISLPLAYFTEQKKGDLTSRMTSDLVEIEWSIMGVIEMIFKDPINIFIFLITLIVISPELTLFVVILFPVAGILIGYIGKSLKSASKKGQSKMGEIMSLIDENIYGIKIIKSFNAEQDFNKKFKVISNDYKNIMTTILRKKDLASPMSEFLSTIVMVIVMWFGGQLVLSQDAALSAEEFIAYILIFSQIIPPAKSLTSSYYYIQKGSAASERVFEVLEAKNTITDDKNAVTINKIEEEIKFNIPFFKYENTQILNNILFSIKKGEKVALVGKSGSGKSTIADLLARFYDLENGQITIDKTNIKKIKIVSLRSLMGIVNQESILFNDTIFNNIKIGNINASEKEVIEAARNANAHDFIIECEKGYQTNIGNLGEKLSGGQKQRISIARAILKNPEILILDEATSSLDSKSEKLVQDAILKLMKNRTTLVIAHRLSTIIDADKIIVLEKGNVIAMGKHNDLIEQNLHYKSLYDLQLLS
ncbi:ABC transporter ATP-binding protein/permease [Flavobacteriales bacterium]|nr:ABC transporter ATP-binding protein/permease [Flavobacteriales bacterium]